MIRDEVAREGCEVGHLSFSLSGVDGGLSSARIDLHQGLLCHRRKTGASLSLRACLRQSGKLFFHSTTQDLRPGLQIFRSFEASLWSCSRLRDSYTATSENIRASHRRGCGRLGFREEWIADLCHAPSAF